MSECYCEHCVLGRKIASLLHLLPMEAIKIINDLRDHLAEAETNLQVLQAKIEGTWPKNKDEKYIVTIRNKRFHIESKEI